MSYPLVILGLTVPIFLILAGARIWLARGRRASVLRILGGTATGAVLGFVLVSVLAAIPIADYHREYAPYHFGSAALALGGFAIVLPAASYLALHAVGVRPAWLATLGAWPLFGIGLLVAQTRIPDGTVQSPWFYGTVAVLPYALAAALAVWAPEKEEPELSVAAPVA